MLFNKTMSMYYSLFVFRLFNKIISLSFLNLAGRKLAGRGLTRHLARRYWPGPNINGSRGPGPKF